MNNKHTGQTTRRRLALDALRWAMTSGFGLLSLRLTRRESGIQEHPCIDVKGLTGCRNCPVWDACRLPRALSVKQFINNDKQKS
ncbi:MAG TPA: hypothetical protein PK052_04835 [Anaerohalosphaeraceae bacterium]|nr:hypothetical protein [Phycisphaerae bacterium]HOK97134.1 hypothetical protein [Anaerohalosphaeraceae bacterium]HOL31287.1 hypothetical protein [Anaerohalosphaeraceae bacterium]HOM76085.1 hypothetical protein [Anaerohalosphaeraceae bacterium]HPC64799.1 hypothetical protein [Anaerohalosphaeraceae bacterium]